MLVVGNLFRSGLFCVDFCRLFRRLICEISKTFFAVLFAVLLRYFSCFSMSFRSFSQIDSSFLKGYFLCFFAVFYVHFRISVLSFYSFFRSFTRLFRRFWVHSFVRLDESEVCKCWFSTFNLIVSCDDTKAKFKSVNFTKISTQTVGISSFLATFD